MLPSIGDTGIVEITHISPTGNAHVKITDEKHLNIGNIDCSVGDSVKVQRLDEKYCKCLDPTLRADYYLFGLSRMREHDDEVNSENCEIEEDFDDPYIDESVSENNNKNPDSDIDSDSEFVCKKCGGSFQFESVLRKHKYSCEGSGSESTDSDSHQPSENTNQQLIPSSTEWSISSLAAATTLEADDIEDAFNRLETAGYSHEQAIGYVCRYLKDMLQGEGLFAVYGIGPSNGSSLIDAGITTTKQLGSGESLDCVEMIRHN